MKSIEHELQRRLNGEGLLVRTIDCQEGERLLPCGTTEEGRGGLTYACLKERQESALERCLAGELRLSRGLNRDMSKWLPASFWRHDLPLAAYEGKGPCTAGEHIGCATAGVPHVGLILPVPDAADRGPAFPHDAWTEFMQHWNDVRKPCSERLPADAYARQRLEYEWSAAPCNGSSLSLGRFAGTFARNISVTCWDKQWDVAVARQRAYWSQGELDSRAMGCGHAGGAYNQVGVAAAHWRKALAIFYRVRDATGAKSPAKSSSALRVALLARDVFHRLGATSDGPLPVVEFQPASLAELTATSLRNRTWRQQAVGRAFRAMPAAAAAVPTAEVERAVAAVALAVNATPCHTAACARQRRLALPVGRRLQSDRSSSV